jgi:Family of unknown function (DUF5681)
MSEEYMSDGYEVGYRKPPRSTQFKKGSSGNPKGRPRKTLDFHLELLREFGSSITINENGRRRRISKYEAVIKQLAIKAMSGNLSAIRILLGLCQVASEKDALLETTQSRDPRTRPASALTDEEIYERIIYLQKQQEKEKEHVSNAD